MCSLASLKRNAFAVSFLMLLAAPSCWAQITNVTNDQSTPIPGAGHDYIKMLSETVNPANGSVSLRIQAPAPKGRLLNIPFGFDQDTNGVHHLAAGPNGSPIWVGDSTPYSRGGWSYLIPLVTYVLGTVVETNGLGGEGSSCSYYSGFVFRDPNGTSHALGIASAQPYSAGSCLFPLGNVTNAGDDYYRASTPANFGEPSATVVSADGTVYNFLCTPCSPNADGDAMATVHVEDRNGNIATSTSNNSTGAYSLTDTLKRALISISSFASSAGDTIYLSGLANAYVVTWKTETSNFTVPIEYVDGSCTVPANSDQRTVVSSITLPNGQAYTFLYGTDDPTNSNPYGLLSKIVYPSGGWVKYQYGINSESDAFLTTVSGSNGQAACDFLYGTPAVTQRTVSFDGTHVALQQTFAYSTAWNSIEWTSKTSTVTTNDMISGQTSVTNYVYSPVNIPNPPDMSGGGASQVPVESTVTYKDGSGNVLQTVTKKWQDQYLLTQEQITPTGLTTSSMVQYSYGSGGQVTKKTEYDYGQSSPTKITTLTYQTFPNTPVYTAGPSIFDRPCQIVISNGNNNRIAETDYLYDGGTSLCGTPGTSSTGSASTPSGTHDETNYGPSSTNPRGNATKKTVLCLQSCTNAVTTFTYDETGQELAMIDPCGNSTCADMVGTTHTTGYSYSDSYTSCSGSAPPAGNSNAYLTKITDPLGHAQSFCYGYADGQVRGSTDPNAQTTSYTYNDPLGRLTLVTDADNGQTTYSYVDAPPAPTVTTHKELKFGTSTINVSTMDGTGHVTQTQLTSDPDGTDTTVKTYDGSGDLLTVTNPYRTTGDSTYGVTTYTYDALGRTTEVADADQSTVVTSYGACPSSANANASATTVTDEAGVTRETCADGLGRMTYVIENPGGLAYQTNYTYDVLSDLTSVVQNGSRQRTYAYNSLAQLTSSTNPESNTAPSSQTTVPTTYSYDASGNLMSKVMPAQNQQGTATVTLSYCYDADNRMTSKAYTLQSCPMSSPVASYSYDNAACLGQSSCFNVGRRTGMADAGGTENWSYDPMGRVLADQRTTNGITKSTIYTYVPYVDGSINTITYPSGRVITYTTSAAERTLSAVDSSVNYATGAHYIASGALSAVENGGVLNSTFIYNDRLQPCWSYGTTSTALASTTTCTASDSTPGNILDLQYKYHGFGHNVDVDNGDVLGVTNNRDTTRSQTFTYDALNRLLTAETTSTYLTSPTHCWAESYQYDNQSTGGAWGNLTAITPATGTYTGCEQESGLSVTVNAENQFTTSGYGYDTAGNMTQAPVGNSYTYDAENHLVSAAGVAYTYDGDGKRIEKSVSGTVNEIYWYGYGNDALDETDGSGSTTDSNFFEYIFFGGKRIARRDSSGNLLYYFADHLGSSRTIAEVLSGQDTATLCYDADFYPFGGERAYTDTCSQNYKFTGKERDTESNLDNFGSRYNSSAMGRWLSPDIINLTSARLVTPGATLNKYVYGGDNPLRYVDRDGKDITIFYRPSGGSPTDFGHVFIAALNQDTGRVGFLDYYPQGRGNGPGQFNLGDMQDRAAMSSKFATLTIRTTPEEAQKVLDLIKKLTDGSAPDYAALSNNCTTVCEDVLRDLGLDFGDILPDSYWAHVYGHNAPAALENPFKNFFVPRQTGVEYGNPRNYGMNFTQLLFQLYLNQQHPCNDRWDAKNNTLYGCY